MAMTMNSAGIGISGRPSLPVRPGGPAVTRLGLIVIVAAVSGMGFVQAENRSGNSAPALSPAEHIDHLIETKLAEKQITPNPAAVEATFLRRVYLDLIGRIPTLEEIEAFHADASEDRRMRLIEELLES